jgi:ferric-dicitrate binding protein FerR (iron transport regulator)
MKYAAILILVAGVSGMLGYVGSDLLREKRVVENREFTSEQMFSAAKGSIASVVLSDGTKISLNSGSEVVYTVAQSGERNVKLRRGYFEVTHMQDRPFVVEVAISGKRSWNGVQHQSIY